MNQNYTNPQYVGAGYWMCIHILAFNCKVKDRETCILSIKQLCYQFPCEKCREHAKEYIKHHPIEDSKKEDLGLFVWTWKFHNAVNFRIGKHSMSWDMAYHLYDSLKSHKDEECSAECSVSE